MSSRAARPAPPRSPRPTLTGSPPSTARSTPSSTSTPRARSPRPATSTGGAPPARSLDVMAGVPIAVKDVMATKGCRPPAARRSSRAGSALRRHAGSRLRAAGMPILGKTNMDEFAMGLHRALGLRPDPQPVGPRAHPRRVRGGSSAAVAAFEAPLAIGTDTGGRSASPRPSPARSASPPTAASRASASWPWPPASTRQALLAHRARRGPAALGDRRPRPARLDSIDAPAPPVVEAARHGDVKACASVW